MSNASFASSLRRLHIKRQSLALSEEDYLRLQSPPPKLPKAGYVLIQRRPRSDFFSITWNDGQSLKFMTSPDDIRKMAMLGINKERAEKALNHAWNLGAVYVKLNDGASNSPPSRLPRHHT